MPQRQLNIRSDEAVQRAKSLARQHGKTTTEIVVDALRHLDDRTAPLDELGLTPDQRAEYDALRALSRDARPHVATDAPAGHNWLYDEDGLPK